MAETASPMLASEVDLTDFSFMPLEIERLRKSKAWLVCRRRPELAFYMLNLWMRSWHERPAASIEDDDDVLADAAGCSPEKWPEVRADALRGWVKCSDGRLYHPVVAVIAAEKWADKLTYRWHKECARLKKENQRRKDKGLEALPFPPDPKTLSPRQIEVVPETSPECPEENLLKGEGEGEGECKGEGDSLDGAGAPSDQSSNLDGAPESEVVELWNETAETLNAELGRAEWPRVQKLTGPRRKQVKQRLRDAGGIEGIRTALARARADPWARGDTRRPAEHANWRFNFDYFIKEKTFTQIMERPDEPARRPIEQSSHERQRQALAEWSREGDR
jgi:hypothetical protein